MSKSLAQIIAELPEEEQAEIFKDYTEEDFKNMAYDWPMWARPEQLPPDDTSWHIYLALAGRGWGKLTGVYTKVPTPNGWTTMGELKAGDYVFGEDGRPVRVKQAFTPTIPEKMYRITFSDGTTIDCGEEHLWTTWTHADRKSYDALNNEGVEPYPKNWPELPKNSSRTFWDEKMVESLRDLKSQRISHKDIANQLNVSVSKVNQAVDRFINKNIEKYSTHSNVYGTVKTTAEIVETLKVPYKASSAGNHQIPVAGVLEYSEKDLPIHPYLFGYLLGDGATNGSGIIASGEEDAVWLVDTLAHLGYEAAVTSTDPQKIHVKGIRKAWRDMNLHEGKYIPEIYLQGSYEQRMELIYGLNDSDGSVKRDSGSIVFTNTNKRIIDGYVELLRSVSEIPKKHYYPDRSRYGVTSKPAWVVCTSSSKCLTRLPRKSALFRAYFKREQRARTIVAAEEIEPVLSRCIAVESDNHLFLVGEGMIPTHNSRAGAEWVRHKVESSETPIEILLLGRTSSDVRDVMVKAIIDAAHPDNKPIYLQSKRRLEWPNGSFAICTSSEKPDQLRGPQGHIAWADELAALKATTDDSGATAWSNLLAATRLGDNPQIFCTTTPKRTALMKQLVKDAEDPTRRIKIVTGSTFDNVALSENYLETITAQYGDSDLAKQELYGQMLGDAEGLFFNDQMIEDHTIMPNQVPHLPLKFIAVDPSVAEKPTDEAGIVAMGVTGERDISKRTAYVLEDYSIKGSPDIWIQRVVDAAREQRTKFIVVEGNQGRQLLQMAINTVDPTLKIFLVNARHGKHQRAEPVIMAMQQGRIKLVDEMPDLTDQMIFFDPTDTKSSPDRMDAMVWGITAALLSPPDGLKVYRSSVSSGANRRLPQGRGTGRTRHASSLRRGNSGRGGSRFG